MEGQGGCPKMMTVTIRQAAVCWLRNDSLCQFPGASQELPGEEMRVSADKFSCEG